MIKFQVHEILRDCINVSSLLDKVHYLYSKIQILEDRIGLILHFLFVEEDL